MVDLLPVRHELQIFCLKIKAKMHGSTSDGLIQTNFYQFSHVLLVHSSTKLKRSDDVREKMRSKYLDNPDYTFEKVNRASLACGPMVKWAIAQVSLLSKELSKRMELYLTLIFSLFFSMRFQIEYADMLKRVEPLRDELKSLEDQASLNMKNAQDTKDLITQLEQSIAAYKEEYAQLISQAQAIKTDLENVQAKVDRSIALLESLNIERDRWEETSETFRSQMSTIVGDVLLSSAFIAYGKFRFD